MENTMTHKFFTWLIFLFLLVSSSISVGYAQPPEQHVILVIIDGARYTETLGDPTDTYTPNLRMFAEQGTIVQTFLNDSITITRRAIPAIWCGSWSTPHDTIINGFANQYATVPSVWEYFRKDRNLSAEDAMYITKALNSPWQQSYHSQYGPPYWPWYICQGVYDLDVWQNAKIMLETYHPKLAVLYFADVDEGGHSGDWARYTRAITITDSIVGLLWDFLQEDAIFNNTTTVLVTNDHGRHTTSFTSHGDGCIGCRQIIFAAAGPAVKQHFASSTNRSIPDITPTIASILNFTTPYSSGHSMTELLAPIYYRERDSINFGTVVSSSSKIDSFKLYNSGAVPLTISSIVSSDAQVTVDPNSDIISPHSSKTFFVTCQPAGLKATLKASLIIQHNANELPDTVQVVGTLPISVLVTWNNRWNMVSVPLMVSDWRKDSIFSFSVSSAYAYEGNYQIYDTVERGKGYWMKFSGVHTDTLLGDPIMIDTVTVLFGWNLIGSISKPVPVSSITTNTSALVASSFFGYSSSYFQTDTIFPGKGYWVKVNQAGSLILSASSLAAKSSAFRIKIVPTSELPPPPPDYNSSGLTQLPKEYAVENAYPSPFNPASTITYQLPEQSRVTLKVYNLLGEVVSTLVDMQEEAGYKSIEWNAGSCASGVYYYRLEAISTSNPSHSFTQVKKMVLLK